MKMIRFVQLDPHYAKCNLHSEVIVNVESIVKIEPVWYNSESGRFARIYVGEDDDSAAMGPNAVRQFAIHDELDNVYYSSTASDQGQALINDLWKSAI